MGKVSLKSEVCGGHTRLSKVSLESEIWTGHTRMGKVSLEIKETEKMSNLDSEILN